MSNKHLHIISFDVPYPPNYGGVIDVFYKITELHSKGIQIHLHVIEYPGRQRAVELNDFCKTVNYYPRVTGIKSAFSWQPYIVKSRRSEDLINNLLKDQYPILFEGMHSCYYIDDPRLKGRLLIYRESNIEHQYYFNLFKAEHHFGKKAYFLIESFKLLLFQKKLKHADVMMVVSESDYSYLKSNFKHKEIHFLPSFHANNAVTPKEGKGEYFLYHGNIEVPENEAAALYLIEKVFAHLPYKLIIAGMNPPKTVQQMAIKYHNVQIVSNPDQNTMLQLIQNAQANILVTFQASGLKLKLLNTLYQGRYCIVNQTMLSGTGLDDLCLIGNTTSELKNIIKEVAEKPFTIQTVTRREEILNKFFSNHVNGERMVNIIFNR